MGDDNDLSNLRESCGDVLKLQCRAEFAELLNSRELVRSQLPGGSGESSVSVSTMSVAIVQE